MGLCKFSQYIGQLSCDRLMRLVNVGGQGQVGFYLSVQLNRYWRCAEVSIIMICVLSLNIGEGDS